MHGNVFRSPRVFLHLANIFSNPFSPYCDDCLVCFLYHARPESECQRLQSYVPSFRCPHTSLSLDDPDGLILKRFETTFTFDKGFVKVAAEGIVMVRFTALLSHRSTKLLQHENERKLREHC